MANSSPKMRVFVKYFIKYYHVWWVTVFQCTKPTIIYLVQFWGSVFVCLQATRLYSMSKSWSGSVPTLDRDYSWPRIHILLLCSWLLILPCPIHPSCRSIYSQGGVNSFTLYPVAVSHQASAYYHPPTWESPVYIPLYQNLSHPRGSSAHISVSSLRRLPLLPALPVNPRVLQLLALATPAWFLLMSLPCRHRNVF